MDSETGQDPELKALGTPEPDLEPPPGSPAQFDSTLVIPRRKLLEQASAHVAAVKSFMGVGDLYTIDVFLVGVANRSMLLVRGFVDAFDKWNVFAAAPLVRLQVDSLLRVSYMTRAPSSDVVADEVMKGHSFRSLKDADGNRLTDAHLLELALPHHPWLKNVYSSGSEWIHLSTIQVMAPWEFKKGAPVGRLALLFPMRRSRIPAGFLGNMVAAMSEATDDLLTYIDLWRRRKGLPLGEARD
jgi:hypothetical protein